jgi:hypothetical protein
VEQFSLNRGISLSYHLRLKLTKRYEPSSLVSIKYKGNDLTFKTDDEGNPIVLFIGKELPNGKIRGERYARRLKRDEKGNVIKDHWELKGKAS